MASSAKQQDLIQQALQAPGDRDAAARILPLLDLHGPNTDDDEDDAQIINLCDRAVAYGVAAVCLRPRLVAAARRQLLTSPVRLASWVNFPQGSDDIAQASKEARQAVSDGADEIDLLAPVKAIIDGDLELCTDMVRAVNEVADGRTVKVILETGQLADAARITAAARAAVMAGAAMLETSTGRFKTGCSLEDAAVLLAALEEAGGRVGLKLAGGIEKADEAARYLWLVEQVMTPGWISPKTLRFGGFDLLDDLVRVLQQPGEPPA